MAEVTGKRRAPTDRVAFNEFTAAKNAHALYPPERYKEARNILTEIAKNSKHPYRFDAAKLLFCSWSPVYHEAGAPLLEAIAYEFEHDYSYEAALVLLKSQTAKSRAEVIVTAMLGNASHPRRLDLAFEAVDQSNDVAGRILLVGLACPLLWFLLPAAISCCSPMKRKGLETLQDIYENYPTLMDEAKRLKAMLILFAVKEFQGRVRNDVRTAFANTQDYEVAKILHIRGDSEDKQYVQVFLLNIAENANHDKYLDANKILRRSVPLDAENGRERRR